MKNRIGVLDKLKSEGPKLFLVGRPNFDYDSFLMLNPLRGYVFLVFLSHQLLRMLFPFLLLLLFVSSYGLSPTLFLILSAGLGLMVAGSLAGLIFDQYFQGHNPLGFITLVFFNCLAVFWGTAKYCVGAKVKSSVKD